MSTGVTNLFGWSAVKNDDPDKIHHVIHGSYVDMVNGSPVFYFLLRSIKTDKLSVVSMDEIKIISDLSYAD